VTAIVSCRLQRDPPVADTVRWLSLVGSMVKTGNVRTNVTLRRVRVTIVAVEKQ
jgi:hypothetical protein